MARYIGLIFGVSLLFLVGCCTAKKTSSSGVANGLQKRLDKEKTLELTDGIYDLKGSVLLISGALNISGKAEIRNGILEGRGGVLNVKNTKGVLSNIKITGNWTNKNASIKWFSDGSDGIENFIAICNLIELGVEVELDRFYAIRMPSINHTYNTTKDIRIRGVNAEKCGLILETKHSLGKAYFQSSKGSNISISNVSIISGDFQKGVHPQGYDYHFAMSYYSSIDRGAKPDFDYFRLDGCHIKGAIGFRYALSSDNTQPSEMLTSGIKEISIKGCSIEEAVTLLELSNGRYESAVISDNQIKNIYGATFFFPLGGMAQSHSAAMLYDKRGELVFSGNTIENDELVSSLGNGYMSPIIAKGSNFTVRNNTIRNLLNSRNGIETVPFYCSASQTLRVTNNTILNVAGTGLGIRGGGGNCLLKLKGAKNSFIEGNSFTLDKSALVKLGLLKNENQNINMLSAKRFRFSLWGAELNSKDFLAKYEFVNNTFKAPIITDYSIASRSFIYFINNTIEIECLPNYDETNYGDGGLPHNGTLICLRDITKNGILHFLNNRISIDKLNTPILYFTKDVNDNKHFREVIYKDNIFKIDGAVSLAFPRTDNLITDNRLSGTGSIIYNEASTAKKNRSIGKLDARQTVDNYKSDFNSSLHLKTFGTSEIIAKKNASQTINILDIRLNDLYHYNDRDQLPIEVNIKVSLTDLKNKKQVEYYTLIFEDHQSVYYVDRKTGRTKQGSPLWVKNGPDFRFELKPNGNMSSSHPLVIVAQNSGKRKGGMGFLVLENVDDVKSFSIMTEVSKCIVDSRKRKESIKGRLSQKSKSK